MKRSISLFIGAFLLTGPGCGGGTNSDPCADATPGDDGQGSGCEDPTSSPGEAIGADGTLIKADPAKAYERFGEAVVMDANTLAVSSPYDPTCGDSGEVTGECADSGSVYVYNIGAGGALSQSQILRLAPPTNFDALGSALALDGDTLAVGAARSNRCPPSDPDSPDCQSSGAVYIFERSGGDFTQVAELHASNFDAFDRFGYALALRGERLAVGAVGQGTCGDPDPSNIDPTETDGPSCGGSGAVYIYEKQGGDWVETAFLKSDVKYTNGNLGTALALTEDRIFVGAQGESRVLIYGQSEEGWRITSSLKPLDIESTGPVDWPNLGQALSLAGDYLVIGASSFGAGGEVFILEEGSPDQWSVVQKLAPLIPDYNGGGVGKSLAISPKGDRMVVGAPRDDLCGDPTQATGECVDAGSLFVFEGGGASWSHAGSYRANLSNRELSLGEKVALNDDFYAGTAPGKDGCASGVGADTDSSDCDDAGAVYFRTLP